MRMADYRLLWKDWTKEVWLLIGGVGSGKSSLLNTISASLHGGYIANAPCGGGSGSNTLDLLKYPNCGVPTSIGTEQVKDVVDKLPNIFDFAGLTELHDMEAVAEIIEAILGGYIPDGTLLDDLLKKRTELGAGKLKRYFSGSQSKETKITKVIFVQSCEDVNTQLHLLRCLHDVLKKKNVDNKQLLFKGINKFVAFTKYDKVCDDGWPQWKWLQGRQSSGSVSRSEFQQLEDRVSDIFQMKNTLEENRFLCINYNDLHANRISPSVDNAVLKLLKKMLQRSKLPPSDPPQTWAMVREDKLAFGKRCTKRLIGNLPPNAVYAAVIFILVAVIIVIVLNKGL